MKSSRKLISCFLFIFMFLELIFSVNSGNLVFAYSNMRETAMDNLIVNESPDSNLSGQAPKDEFKDSTKDLNDNLNKESVKGSEEEIMKENGNTSVISPEDLEEMEKNIEQVKVPEIQSEANSDFLLGEEISVLQGKVLESAISSWAFAGLEDVNKDGIIDEKDVSLVASRYNAVSGQSNYDASMDVNGDGIIDVYDIARISGKAGTKGTIVVDPGHGGSDPGAIGPSGLKEKDVVLKVGLKVRDFLESYGYTVVMTRTTDVYVSLQERCDIANNSDADFFISIHNNSFYLPSAHGTETFSYNDYDLGAQIARSIQNKLISSLGRYNRGHKTADFYVLRNTKMPAALAELAFISNPTEEALLKTDEFQTKAARAIVDGIIGN